MTLPKKNDGMNTFNSINPWLLALLIVLVCTGISWGLVSALTISKPDVTSEINRISNDISHLTDAQTGLNNFSTNQNAKIDNLGEDTQVKIDEANGRIDDSNTKVNQIQENVSTVKTQADNLQTTTDSLTSQYDQLNNQLTTTGSEADDTKSALDTLTTTVNGLAAGLQITPTVSVLADSSGNITGTIILTMNSDMAQTTAFKIEFRSTSTLSETTANNKIDEVLQLLYGTPPITMTAGTVSVRGDYTLFWNAVNTKYCLGTTFFTTPLTSLTAGANTKQITFTIPKNTTTMTSPSTYTFDILITSEFSTGTSTGVW